MKRSSLISLFILALLGLPACGGSSSESDNDDAAEGALEQKAGKYNLKDYTMVVSRVAVNEAAMPIVEAMAAAGFKSTTDKKRFYVGITEKDAGLGTSEETIFGLACREGGGDMIEVRCDFYATVKTANVKETEPDVTELTIDGKLAKLIADSFSKAKGKEVTVGNLKCVTAGTPKCTMLVSSDHVRTLEGWVDPSAYPIVERELSFFYP